MVRITEYSANMHDLTFKLVTDDDEQSGAFEVRKQVFVHDQGVSEELEYDGKDEQAMHMVVKDGARVIGTARVRFLSSNRAKIERLAILKAYRSKGIGSNIIAFLKMELKNRHIEQIILHAQYALVKFYDECGFDATGKPFWEAGIKHIKMQLRLI